MGEYAPDDQRTVHNSPNGEWQEREDDDRSRAEQRESSEAQMGYGNARNEDGQMEQDSKRADIDGAQPGEVSSSPAERARADASRPLSGS